MEEAQQRIESWQSGQLDLSDLDLREVPESIGNLSNLINVRLDGNQLSALPESFERLTNLMVLRLDGNQLSSTPEIVTSFSNLIHLRLDGNQLAALPESISNLTKLTYLGLDRNQLSSVPESVSKLTNLIVLRLGANQLTSVPESLGNLSNLTYLGLGNNQLSSLPKTMVGLRSLTSVNMSETPTSVTTNGSLTLGGNRWSPEFHQAAEQGVEALWEYLRTGRPVADANDRQEPDNHDRPATDEDAVKAVASNVEAVTTLSVADAGMFFRDLESNLGQIENLHSDGFYSDHPPAENTIRRRLSQLRDEQQNLGIDGELDIEVIGALIGNLLRTVAPFHIADDGGDVANEIVEAYGPEPSTDGTPERLLEASAKHGAPVVETAEKLNWLPSLEQTAAIVTVGAGAASVVSLTLELDGVAGALSVIAFTTAAYIWHRKEKEPTESSPEGQ